MSVHSLDFGLGKPTAINSLCYVLQVTYLKQNVSGWLTLFSSLTVQSLVQYNFWTLKFWTKKKNGRKKIWTFFRWTYHPRTTRLNFISSFYYPRFAKYSCKSPNIGRIFGPKCPIRNWPFSHEKVLKRSQFRMMLRALVGNHRCLRIYLERYL